MKVERHYIGFGYGALWHPAGRFEDSSGERFDVILPEPPGRLLPLNELLDLLNREQGVGYHRRVTERRETTLCIGYHAPRVGMFTVDIHSGQFLGFSAPGEPAPHFQLVDEIDRIPGRME